ncbi:MAG: hypothetical protein V4485_06440 [Pseudomonadota bacterium]
MASIDKLLHFSGLLDAMHEAACKEIANSKTQHTANYYTGVAEGYDRVWNQFNWYFGLLKAE